MSQKQNKHVLNHTDLHPFLFLQQENIYPVFNKIFFTAKLIDMSQKYLMVLRKQEMT